MNQEAFDKVQNEFRERTDEKVAFLREKTGKLEEGAKQSIFNQMSNDSQLYFGVLGYVTATNEVLGAIASSYGLRHQKLEYFEFTGK